MVRFRLPRLIFVGCTVGDGWFGLDIGYSVVWFVWWVHSEGPWLRECAWFETSMSFYEGANSEIETVRKKKKKYPVRFGIMQIPRTSSVLYITFMVREMTLKTMPNCWKCLDHSMHILRRIWPCCLAPCSS